MDALKWRKLEESRQEHRLALFYDIYYGNTILDRSTLLDPPSYISRGDHQQKVKLFQTRSNSARHSFFTRTVFEWNNLPEHLTSSTSKDVFIRGIVSLRKDLTEDHLCSL